MDVHMNPNEENLRNRGPQYRQEVTSGIIPIDSIFVRESLDSILDISHRITTKEPLINREHMARPYPSQDFDFLAINVPSSYQQGMIPDGEEPPWGMLRVVAMARESFGFNAGILDAHRLRLQPDEIREQLLKTKAKIVGLNPTSVNVPEAMLIAHICDELNIPYILGGVHATLDPSIAREDFPNAFAIVRGNGEIAIGEVLEAALYSGQRSNDNGIYYEGHNIGTRFDYAKKLNPGEIPMIRQDVYIEEPVYTHTVEIHGQQQRIHEATLFVTDGCPFDCTFCSSPVMVNRGNDIPYARPEMVRIVDEIEHAVNDVGADAIHMLDDMAFIKGSNIREFHAELKRRNLLGEFIWRGLTRAPVIIRDDFGSDVMEMMKESGAWKIALGVESGSDEILKQIRKKVTRNDVIQAVSKLGRYGIQVKGFFIMGFPGETESQIKQTYDFIFELQALGLTEIAVFQFKPYPGTHEHLQMIQTQPEVMGRLDYLRRDAGDLSPMAEYRTVQKDVWLPDDLKIAEVPSGVVKQYVTAALEQFYGTSVSSHTDMSCT
jgi:anaerobic magnesium-protoporphyrin IX monomethyl ester cyclase